MYLFLSLLICFAGADAQRRTADSLTNLLTLEKIDSNRVTIMNKLANTYNQFDPAKGLIVAQQAYDLARKIHFVSGEVTALGFMGNAYNVTGNYNEAMELYLRQLAIAEKQYLPRRMATSLMNIAILHTQQMDLRKGLDYYLRSDSIIRVNQLKDFEFSNFVNLGDLYDRLNSMDSAFFYYSKALTRAGELNNAYYLGASFIGLGNCYVKMSKNEQGLAHYYKALQYLKLANQDDLYCETANNMAKLFESENKKDSALHYAKLMYSIAEKDGFQSRLVDASGFLANYYKKQGNSDSAFRYLERVTQLKDSMNSLVKVKAFQHKSFSEEIRQAEIAEQKRLDRAERFQQLQLLAIGIFIPIFFLLTLLLSRRKIHAKAIQILGIISLLLLFEYLTLLLHPFVLKITNHTPVFEMLIFVCIAAILIPGHHRIERWLIKRLTHKNRKVGDEIHINVSTLKVKKPSP